MKSSPKAGGEKTTATPSGTVDKQIDEAPADDATAAAKAVAPKKRAEALANEAPIADKAAMPTTGVEATAKDTSTADKAAMSVTRAEATTKNALVISTSTAPSNAVGTSSSAPKPVYLTVKGPDGSIKNTLTTKEVLEEWRDTIQNMTKRVNTFFEKLQKDYNYLENNVNVSVHSLVLPSFAIT
jgi:hypothetical protein